MSDGAYEFPALPIGDVRAGTTLLVAGPTHVGTRDLGLRLLGGPSGEGAIVVTTNQRASRIVDDCRRAGVDVSRDGTAIIDCVGQGDASLPTRIQTVSTPGDLTGIGMRYADVSAEFKRADVDRIRTGLCTMSTLLSFSDLQTVTRFVHTLAGRIDSVDGLGMLLVDPANHDERTVSTLAQFCGGRVDVRETEDGPEFRVAGLAGHDRDWRQFDPA